MRKINLLVVHCSATVPEQNIGIAEIRQWHEQRGWNDIGYHYVIRRDGTQETGRPLERAGAHAKGHNAFSIGICLVGGVDAGNHPQNNFTPTQFASLRRLLLHLQQRFPESRICGHRDLPKVRKACPSFDVTSWWTRNRSVPDNGENSAGNPIVPAKTDWIELLHEIAARHDLPPELVAAMAQVESGGDTWAVRYESGFFKHYLQGREVPGFGAASQETELRTRSMSFGLLQIMGQVARELGCDLPFLSQLCAPEAGLEWSCRYLAQLHSRLEKAYGHTNWECVCAAYNGGPGVVTGAHAHTNPEYTEKIRRQLGGHWPQ